MVGPKILILDEPLAGCDPDSQKAISDLLVNLSQQEGKAVFFSSHDLRMVRSVAKKVLRSRRRPDQLGAGSSYGSSVVSFFDVLSPSFLLFPALLGSAILAFVCPLVGAHLMLRRRIFLGLTLPQIAACGVAFAFWFSHAAGVSHGTGGERLLAMVGSLVFTLVGMGLLAYLDRHATGSPESRLAAAYAFASALTILFVVFNPAGELEILNLLKGEVISLSKEELKLLAVVYGGVYFGLVLFRREFLLNSFDRDLSFLLTGGGVQWSFWLYVLCGFSIAIGVIMAGPLLVFGFMVLPPLAARSLARGMNSFFVLIVADWFVHRPLWFLFIGAAGLAAWANRCSVWLCGHFCGLRDSVDRSKESRFGRLVGRAAASWLRLQHAKARATGRAGVESKYGMAGAGAQ